MPEIDDLQIVIDAQAKKATTSIDTLIGKVDLMEKALAGINTANLIQLSNGVNYLGRAMLGVKQLKKTDFTSLKNGLNVLSKIDTSQINSASATIQHLVSSLNGIGSVSDNAIEIGLLASNLSKLGYKSIANATKNIPILTMSLTQMFAQLSKAPAINKNVIDMTNALANLSAQSKGIPAASKAVNKSLQSTNTVMQSTSKNAWSLASAFGKLYANYFLLIRAGGVAMDSIMGTADYFESFNYYTVAFGKVASEWKDQYKEYGYENAEEYAESFTTRMNDVMLKMSGVTYDLEDGLLKPSGVKNLGLNIQEVTQYASQLASVTNSVGQTGETTLATSRAFVRLGSDMSSLFNMDYSDVMRDLQSGLLGQSRALTYIAHKHSNVFKKTPLISGNSCERKTIRSQVLNWKGSTTIEMVA